MIGKISGLIVILSVIPYAVRVYQDKIKPNIVSWGLWSLIGLSLLLTYDAAGANESIWPAVFGFTNPLMITALLVFKKRNFGSLEKMDKVCLFLSLVSLELWLIIILMSIRELAQFALYLAILADAIAAVPTFRDVCANPESDRPACWGLFCLGYTLSIFAITEPIVSNYVLPIYMSLGSFSITAVLSWHRIKNRIPMKDWI